MFKVFSHDSLTHNILQSALRRSFGNIGSSQAHCFCFVSPVTEDLDAFRQALTARAKIMVVGALPTVFAQMLGLSQADIRFCDEKATVEVDVNNSHNTSIYHVHYGDDGLLNSVPYRERHFERFDFTNEWNNLGYGRISNSDDIWSVSQPLTANGTRVLAEVRDADGFVSVFASITDFDEAAVLFVNRPVSVVDGLDWGMVEQFFAAYRADELVCLPLISDLPKGCKSVVSSRLDCDQSIINAQPLVKLYKKYGIDLSLAISTGIPISGDDVVFLKAFSANGGCLVSHTVTHHYGWGRDYAHALEEAKQSKEWLETNLAPLRIPYAVSPFHSNPPYAVQALKDAGYEGFISGIIHNDPEYLCAVSGQVPFVDGDMVMHAQQCMMHGDCFHRYGNSIAPYVEAFDLHYRAGKMFGYLDHPFGGYDYGWASEEERLQAHESFIRAINQYEGVRWMTLEQILNFVKRKNEVKMRISGAGDLIIDHKAPDVQVYYKGEWY